MDLANVFPAGQGMALNRRVMSMSDCSTPIRSRLEAPTKPTHSVCWFTIAASAGVEIGPPWLRKKMSFRTCLAAAMMALVRSTA